ncbi:hypothetical protein S40293_10905 [Stachybotrys chartarum IBT 40293]|nr:hypothetical protein S40293_10905 [Stachybotrys chartarum IBT 40293]
MHQPSPCLARTEHFSLVGSMRNGGVRCATLRVSASTLDCLPWRSADGPNHQLSMFISTTPQAQADLKQEPKWPSLLQGPCPPPPPIVFRPCTESHLERTTMNALRSGSSKRATPDLDSLGLNSVDMASFTKARSEKVWTDADVCFYVAACGG